jgi:glutamate synthase domain-containing protein 2
VGQPAEFAALCHAMLATGVAPDFITVDGAEGGTGAAPLEFQNSVGFPLTEGLRLVDSFLIGAGLRDEVKLIASGKVYSGFSLVRTLAHGADLTNAARAFMFSLGCIQALKCNSNMCPTGITTQDPTLEAGLDVESKSHRIARFHRSTVHSALEIVGAVGAHTPSEVKREHLFRREQGLRVANFSSLQSDLKTITEPGILLSDPASVAPQLAQWWEDGGRLHASMREQ